jgi:putative hydrolase
VAETLSPGIPTTPKINLVKRSDFDRSCPFDFHMHTSHTDGSATVMEMAEASQTAGLKQILYTEHVRHTSTYYPNFVKEVRSLSFGDIDISVGIETKILGTDGSLDCSPSVAALADAIVGSVHNPPPLASAQAGSWSGMELEAALELEFHLAMAIVTKSRAHILGHPMGIAVTRFNLKPLGHLYELACACRDFNKAFELNARYCGDTDEWIQLVERAGCKVSLGSDAHKTSDMGRAWGMFAFAETTGHGTASQ